MLSGRTILERAWYLARTGSYIPPDYYVFDDRRLVYISIPKVACTALKIALIGDEVAVGDSDPMSIHHRGELYHQTTIGRKQRAYYQFAFVRDPFDRLVSFYEDKVRTPLQHDGKYFFDTDYNNTLIKRAYGTHFHSGMSFAECVSLVARIPDWLADGHFKSQYASVFRRGNPPPNHIGKFESLAEDWRPLEEAFNLPPLTRQNRSLREDLSTYYTNASILEIVAERYRKDLEAFGYEGHYQELRQSIPAGHGINDAVGTSASGG